ncbi:uncharacterized protein LOC134829185 [Culicoides brevitarsis]|uniref:uncharacterized protein LOC134829185 n=1 Tax=Culicoides brevitarsis TaxID=469753 RepID=UPI00307C7A87
MFKRSRFKSVLLFLFLTWMTTTRTTRGTPLSLKSWSQKNGSNGKEIVAHRRVVADTSKVTNLTRQHNGDVFFSYDVHKCDTDTCVGLSSGTASLYIESNVKEMDMSISPTMEYECKCQCLPQIHTYREDQGICVDEIRECSMATFTSGSSSEKIPFIFLPLKGQIIYPSKEIFYPGMKESVCEVIGSQYLTKNGWNELRNPSDTTVPFRLFRDEDSTFLQWLGEPDLRYRMQGRLIVVHLACRDMDSFDMTGPEDDIAHGNTFTPCVAFRIVGTPSKYSMNVAEVLFASESQIDEYHFMNLTTKEYIVIGVSSLCLGLIYIASVFLYLHIKKRKARASDGSHNAKDDYTYHQNDQVTFGAGISCGMFGGQSRSSLLNLPSTLNASQRRSNNSVVGGPNSLNLHHAEEMGVIKSNPLLKHYPNLAASDNSGFVSDTSNSNSEFDDDFSIEQESNKQTSAVVHLGRKRGDINTATQQNNVNNDPPQNTNTQNDTECLPEEDVSITEDLSHDDQIENMKALINGNSRRKLYFNPAYFEPHLLASPPPAAIEFLSKIREVISIAKYKMATKRFQPSLTEIPEEKASKEIYQSTKHPPSRRESFISSRNGTQHKSMCSGCSDCQSKSTDHYASNTANNCTNCGDKQKSIQKWLESVSSDHDNNQNDELSDTYINPVSESGSKKSKNDDKYDTIKPEIKPKPNANTNSISSKKSESSISNSDADTVKRVTPASKIGNRTIRTPTNSSPPTKNEDTLPKIVSYCPKPNVIIPDQNSNENDQYGIRVKLDNIYSAVDKGDYYNASSRASSIRGSIKQVPTKEDVIYAFATNKTKKSQSHESDKQSLQENDYMGRQSLYNSIDGGSEIYNNPVFDTSDIKTRTLEKSTEKRNLYEKYKNNKRNSIPYEVINKMNQMPDMIYEAMASDYSRVINNNNVRISSPQLPTPDYTSHEEDTSNATLKRIHQRLQRSMTQNSSDSHPPVPTPDYNTLGRRTPKKLYAPDSPIYSRKSPYSLIVDYETDSLERGAQRDKQRKSATPPSQSSETSQASPSLSSALPLEEELEIRNATYDRVEGFREEADGKNLLMRQGTGPKIKYNTPFLGSMTIEVEHSPDEFDLSTDSDQFEPDTLDRKARKHKNTGFFKGEKSATYFGTDDTSQLMQGKKDTNRSSIRSVDNTKKILENLNKQPCHEHSKSNKNNNVKPEVHKKVENIKNIYEEKSKQPKNEFTNKHKHEVKPEGKLLTLEHRHSKRQRPISSMSTLDKKLAPPDLIPSNASKLSENKIQSFVKALNATTNHTSWAHKHDKSKTKCKYQTQVNSIEDTNDSNSVTSGSTNFTGISDTQGTSEFDAKSKNSNQRGGHTHKKCRKNQSNEEKPMSLLEDYLSLGISNENFFIDHVNKKLNAFKNESTRGKDGKKSDDLDKIEVVSTKTLSNNGSLKQHEENSRKSPSKRSGYKDFDQAINNLPTTTKVFRAEINPCTNGMQIAMGIRDKANKTKEIKSALWRFISIATSKLKGEKVDTDHLNKTIVDQIIDKDDGIGSLLDESAVISISKPFTSSLEKIKPPASSNVSRSNSSRMSSRETDGGYMSADSNELKTRCENNKRLYERFNFSNKVNCISEEISSKLGENDEYEKPLPRPKLQTKDISAPIHANSPPRTTKPSIYMLSPPSRPPPAPPVPKLGVTNPKATQLNITQINGKQMIQQLKDVINVNVQYLSEEEEACGVERYSSNGGECLSSGESEEGEEFDDICESGAESVETHSVFFKNIKNFYSGN